VKTRRVASNSAPSSPSTTLASGELDDNFAFKETSLAAKPLNKTISHETKESSPTC
jgi:hypothetical protein